MVQRYRWYLCTVGIYVPLVRLYRWYTCTIGTYSIKLDSGQKTNNDELINIG